MYISNYKKYERLYEYIVQEISWLKQYLSMSDEEKGRDLFMQHSYIINEYLDEISEIDDPELNEIMEENEWDILAETISNNYPQLWKKIYTHALNNIFRLGIFEQEVPTWAYLDSPKVIKKQWLIHFTEEAITIANNGFDYLMGDISKLGLTTYMSNDSGRSKSGYGFSYLIDDYVRYGKGDRHNGWKYGAEAVLFLASGIRAWHNGDEEYQTIFKGDTVKDIVPITSGEESDYGVYNSKNGRLLYENDDLVRLVDWVLDNYRQYSKVL